MKGIPAQLRILNDDEDYDIKKNARDSAFKEVRKMPVAKAKLKDSERPKTIKETRKKALRGSLGRTAAAEKAGVLP